MQVVPMLSRSLHKATNSKEQSTTGHWPSYTLELIALQRSLTCRGLQAHPNFIATYPTQCRSVSLDAQIATAQALRTYSYKPLLSNIIH